MLERLGWTAQTDGGHEESQGDEHQRDISKQKEHFAPLSYMHPHNIIEDCLGLKKADVKVFRSPLDSEKLDKYGKIADRHLPLLAFLAAMAGCSYGADVTFIRPKLKRVVPITITPQGGGKLRLDLVFLDQQDRALKDSNQIQLSVGRSYPLSALQHDQFGVQELQSTPATGVKVIGTRHLSFDLSEVPTHLVLVLDNSIEALESDPQGVRITASKALVDHLLCSDDQACSFPDQQTAISLVTLQNQGASVVARAIRDRQRLYDLLSNSEREAGGTAPLWDGLVKAVQLASGPGPGGVILYWSSSQGSTAPSEQTMDQLKASRSPLMVVHNGGAEPSQTLSDLARAELEASRGLVELLVAAEALLGSWQLELDVTDLPSPEPGVRSMLSGRVSLDLEDQSWESAFSLPVQSASF